VVYAAKSAASTVRLNAEDVKDEVKADAEKARRRVRSDADKVKGEISQAAELAKRKVKADAEKAKAEIAQVTTEARQQIRADAEQVQREAEEAKRSISVEMQTLRAMISLSAQAIALQKNLGTSDAIDADVKKRLEE
jgi:hypothetical protein